jgi:hypothetical protein
MTTPAPQPQQDKDLDIIRDYIIMSSDWEIQQEMALDALHRIRSRPAPSPQNPCQWIATCDTCKNINCKHSSEAAAIRNATLDITTNWLFKQFKEYTNEEYVFGIDWLADWWIERVGYLRTPEGRDEIESLRGKP